MKRINVFLTEHQIERLRALSRGRSLAELIRQAIDEFLARMDRLR